MQKENLIHFIVHQSQKCLCNNSMTDRVEEYFFWRIVELFCRQNGLSNDVQKKLEEETEPEWLQQLHRLHQIKVANAKTEANCDPAQLVSSNSSATGSEDEDSECGTTSDRIGVPHFQFSEAELDRRYTMGDLLGRGSFGFVFDGVRNKDYKPHHCMDTVPAEVALMQKVCEPPCCSNIVRLIEWIDTPDQFYIILENPRPCMNLEKFAERQDGRLTEMQTRGIMLQVIRAARHCCARGVLHRDIKAQNILINTETLEIKLIDFGCGDWLTDMPYNKFSGTPALWPPEWLINKEYKGIPATVWGLGILTFGLLCGDYPFYLEDELDDGCLDLIPGVSRDVLDLIMWCLELNPDLRPSFEDLLGHEWFTEGV
ncbi:serine/threonine-protein kinase pim-3 isoform X3 [Silurus meridionalis]|nr:serine/threonine-protein kinase pim-3 isoform X3 [Silurus meridionalis]